MIFCKIQKRTCLLFQLQSGQNCQLQNCTFKTLTASFLIQSLDLCYITIFKSEFYLGNYKWVKSTSFQHLHDYFAYHKERRFTKKKLNNGNWILYEQITDSKFHSIAHCSCANLTWACYIRFKRHMADVLYIFASKTDKIF